MTELEQAVGFIRDSVGGGPDAPSISVMAEHWDFRPSRNLTTIYRASLVTMDNGEVCSAQGESPMDAADKLLDLWSLRGSCD